MQFISPAHNFQFYTTGDGTLTLTSPNITGNPNSANGTVVVYPSIGGTVGLNVSQIEFFELVGNNTYTGPTTAAPGSQLIVGVGSLGNTAIDSNITLGTGGKNYVAGTTGPGTEGASLNDSSVFIDGASAHATGTQFILQQESGYVGNALALGDNTDLIMGVNSTTTDEILVNGPGTAMVSGTQYITLDFNSNTPPFTPGKYTLISDPAGGLTGNFAFQNTFSVGNPTATTVFEPYTAQEEYELTLLNSNTSEDLAISLVQLPEPASLGLMCLGGTLLLRRRRKENR
jgi:hypothetical protein